MRVPQGKNWVPRLYRQKRRNQNESRKNIKNIRMANINHGQGNP